MDQNSVPTPGNDQQQVDSVLNDILNGKSAAADPAIADARPTTSFGATSDPVSGMPAPADFPMTPSASVVKADGIGSGLQALKSLAPEPEPVMPPQPVTPMPLASAPVADLPRSTAPVLPPSPVMSSATSTSSVPPKPPMPVGPVVPAKKGPVVAAIALGLVVLGGVGAGVILSQQNADNRQQAYVGPQQVVSRTPRPTPAADNSGLVAETRTNDTARTESAVTAPAKTELGDRSLNVATVFGKICPFGKNFEAGTVIFYSSAANSLIRTAVAAGESAYKIKLDPGQYTAFFEPTNKSFPLFAYTQYVQCGLNPQTCTDHGLLAVTVEKDKEYGQVDLCDPQYTQEGLPAELKYENK